jgi:hypothetical protein
MTNEIMFNEKDIRTFYRFLEHKHSTEIIVFDKVKYPEGKVTWVKNEDEFVEKVRFYNKQKQVDTYVGNRDRVDKNNGGVVGSNNFWIEIDEHDTSKPEELEKVKKFCKENELTPCIGFSGGGYHIYLFHKYLELDNPEVKKKYMEGLLMIRSILQNNNIDVDKGVFDLQRVTRVLGTYNWTRGKLSKIVNFPNPTEQERIRNMQNLESLASKLDNVNNQSVNSPTTGTISQNAIEILEKHAISDSDKWLYDIISKGIVIRSDTGGNSIFFKNAAIVLIKEGLCEDELRVVGKSLADLCEGRTLTALYGWIRKAQNNELAEVAMGEINNAILENGYEISTYKYIDKTDEQIKKSEPLDTISILDCKNHKISKDFLIKDKKYPREVEQVHAPSGSFKSILEVYEAVCVASGRPYLGKFRTKKSPVLFVLAETHRDWLKKKLIPILRGLNVRSNKIPLYFLTRDKVGDLLDPKFAHRVAKTIEDKEIKCVYLDTVNPLTPSIDDNSAKDVTRFFNDFLKPVVDRYGCNITYLHHTDKKGDNFLGSMKWFANSDSVFRLHREGLNNRVSIFNEKGRDGEMNTLEVEIVFSEKKIEFKLISQGDAAKFSKKKKMSQQEFFVFKLNQLEIPKDAERKEIQIIFKEHDINFSTPTLDRALKTWRDQEV